MSEENKRSGMEVNDAELREVSGGGDYYPP